MLQADDIHLRRGQLELFTGLSFTVAHGHKAALVGRNGAGKSTVIALLLGQLQPDVGDANVPGDWRLAHMRQSLPDSDRPALAYVVDGHTELRRAQKELERLTANPDTDGEALAVAHTTVADLGGYEVESLAGRILHGLGFTGTDFTRAFSEFSGGWRVRLELARTLLAPSDALLLDEPTNHLDLETTVWLERWLKRYPGTLLMISHDRDFLDNVVDHVIHLHTGRAASYRGNYSSFERQRAEQLAQQEAQRARQLRRTQEIQTFIDRFRAKATKARQVQSRVKALARMEQIAPVLADVRYDFAFATPERLPYPLATARDVALGYAAEPVLDAVAFSLAPGARVGVLGVNGAGKSTLLKSLTGTLAPLAGELTLSPGVTVGYFAQQQTEQLDDAASAFTHLQRDHPQMATQRVRDLLGGWGFSGDAADRPVRTFSGGERARLVLARIAVQAHAVLVLDEPSNHLDLETRDSLAMALGDFAGALVLVSHDRELLRRTVDEYWLVADSRVRPLKGDLDDYVAQTQARETETAPQVTKGDTEPLGAKAARGQRPSVIRRRAEALERRYDQLRSDVEALERQLAAPDLYQAGSTDVSELVAERTRAVSELQQVEADWLEALDQLESSV